MTSWRQRGFSIFEVLVVVLIIGIGASLAVPRLIGATNNADDGDARATLETAWESAQEFYRGERGIGESRENLTGSSYSGLTPASASKLDGKITWTSDAATFTAQKRPRTVLIARASNQVLALCVSTQRWVLCKADDGMEVNGRLGPRYGASSSNATEAMSRLCQTTPGSAYGDSTGGCSALDSGASGGSPDTDTDGVEDNTDNCPNVANPGQEDADGDGVGDVCDPAPNGPPISVAKPTTTLAERSVGTTMFASAPIGGSWDNSPDTVTLQWQRCTDTGTDCTDIPGATGTSHTTTSADEDLYVRVVAKATNADGSTERASNTRGPFRTYVTLTITSTPAAQVPYTQTTANFAWTTGGGTLTNMYCGLDDGPLDPCSTMSSHTATVSACANHKMKIRASNELSYGPDGQKFVYWRVMCAPPEVLWLNGPATGSPAGPVSFTYQVGPSVTWIRCTLDGVEYPCGMSSFNTTVAPGPHVLTVKVRNDDNVEDFRTHSWTAS